MDTGKDPGSRAREAAPADAFSEGIIIDPGVLHEEKKASSALTDIYGVPLFTDGYEQNVLRAREEDALAREAELDSIFRTVPEGDVYADTVTSLLFAGTQAQVIREAGTDALVGLCPCRFRSDPCGAPCGRLVRERGGKEEEGCGYLSRIRTLRAGPPMTST